MTFRPTVADRALVGLLISGQSGAAMIYTPPTLHDSARWRGLRIGLMGGSFNPPHSGHVHISHLAARALRLDAVWWLVTPHNPLKHGQPMMDYPVRLALCRELTRHVPEIVICDLEARTRTNRTYDTLRAVCGHYPDTDFVFITGMDNALTMHRWYNWRGILDTVATAHIARPPAWTMVENCPLRLLKTQNQVVISRGCPHALVPRTSFWILQTPMRDISSTKIRNYRAL
jgi:nicotinate-nucleotide adenylyltransferase